jgi:serine/threonine protein kinase
VQVITLELLDSQIPGVLSNIESLYKSDHPFIAKFFFVQYDRANLSIRIGLEYASNGSLKDILQRSGRLSERAVASIAAQVVVMPQR